MKVPHANQKHIPQTSYILLIDRRKRAPKYNAQYPKKCKGNLPTAAGDPNT